MGLHLQTRIGLLRLRIIRIMPSMVIWGLDGALRQADRLGGYNINFLSR